MSGTNAAIYVRISSDPQGLRAGVERQTADCIALCERRGWHVVNVYEDNDTSAYSGRKPRKGYQALCEAVRAGVVDSVVCWHPDRLHRSPRELEDFIDLLDASKATVRTVTAGDWDLSTSDGRLTARIVGAVSRKESEDKSRRIRRKHAELAKEGRYHGGSRPFGWVYDVDRSGDLIVNDKEADLIRDAAHKVRRGASCRSIAREWNALGVPTPKGNQWTGAPVKKVLTNPMLTGKHPRTGERAQWTPILTQAQSDAVRAILTSPARRTNGGVVARKNPAAGFLHCGRCGGVLGTGKINGYPAMRCDKGRSGKVETCGRLAVKLEPLVAELGSLVVERLLLARKMLGQASKANATQSDDASSVGDELDALRFRMTEAESMFLDGDLSKAAFLRMKAELEDRQEACMSALATSQDAVALAALPMTRDGLQAAWDSDDFDTRRSYMRLVFERVDIAPAPYKGARFNKDRVVPVFRDLSI